MKTEKDYLQDALQTFNTDFANWYNWEKEDENGNKIPSDERMQYKYVKIMVDGATMPSEEEVNAKIQEFKDEETNKENKKTSGKQKLKDLGLDDDEIQALLGV